MSAAEVVQEPKSIASEIKTAARHSAVYSLGGVLARAIGFFMLPFYTHYLTPVDYGTLEILDLSMSLFGMFLSMGITAALLRSYGAATSNADKRKVVSTAFLFVAATGAVTYGLGLVFVRPVSAMVFGPQVPSTYLLTAFSSLILAYLSALPRTYLRALEASGSLVTFETVGLFIMLGMNVYFIAVLKTGLIGILLSTVIMGVVQTIMLTVWMLRRVGLGFSMRQLRQMMAFGLPLIFSNASLFALNFSDRFFLQHLRSLDMVGLYSVGYKIGFLINYLLVSPFLVMWQARMYIIHAQPDHRRVFAEIFVLYSMLLTYAGLGLAVFSPEIVHIMVGGKFAGSQNVIPVVGLAYVIWGIGYYLQLGLYLTDRTKTVGMLSAAAAVFNLGLNYVLISRFGMMGAAWATAASFLGIAAASYWFSQRALPLRFAIGRVSIAMLMGGGTYVLAMWCAPASFLGGLAVKTVLLALFPVAVWKARLVSPAERRTIVSVWDETVPALLQKFGLGSGRAVTLE